MKYYLIEGSAGMISDITQPVIHVDSIKNLINDIEKGLNK